MRALQFFLLLFLTGCNYPKDPEHSFAKAKEKALIVGVVNNPPYTSFKNDTAKGSEIKILKDFAHTNRLHIQFVEGSESNLIEKLKKYEIHIVAGGFEKKTLWKQQAGPTVTYDSKHLFLIPKGENKLLQKLETQIFESKKK